VFFISLGSFMVVTRNTTNTLFAPLAQAMMMGWLLKTFFGETELPALDYQQGITDEHLVEEVEELV
jgi:hypothetical protein